MKHPTFARSLAITLGLVLPFSSCSRAQDVSKSTAAPTLEGDGIFRNRLKVDKTPMERGTSTLKSYADMLDRVQPSVVTILTGIAVAQRQRLSQDQLLRLWMGQPPIEPPTKSGEESWSQLGVGSGVIVTKDGYILTNKHVVIPPDLAMPLAQYESVMRLRVRFPGRDDYLPAKLVDVSPDMDVAILKIDGTNLPAATLADSGQVRVGDVAFALGAPFGIERTVTMGIISAKRNDEVLEGFEKQELLQTDASINPGNSGGPLIDADGRIIGINTAIYSRNGGNLGIGFAIPINNAVTAADALSKTRGWLGVKMTRPDPRFNRYYGFKGGAMVEEVNKDTPAAEAGLQPYDLILSYDNVTIKDDDDMRRRIAATAPGTKVKLKIIRDDKTGDLTVTIGTRRNAFLNDANGTNPAFAPAKPNSVDDTVDNTVQGLKLAPVPDEQREKYKLSPEVHGLIVSEITPNSSAANAGIEKGDVILQINGHYPTSSKDAAKMFKESSNGDALVSVRRGDSKKLFIVEFR